MLEFTILTTFVSFVYLIKQKKSYAYLSLINGRVLGVSPSLGGF